MSEPSSCVQFFVKGTNYSSSESFVLHLGLIFAFFIEKILFDIDNVLIYRFLISIKFLDEVDVSGICQSQMHCSLKPAYSNCKSNKDCERLVDGVKKFFPDIDVLNLGMRRFQNVFR